MAESQPSTLIELLKGAIQTHKKSDFMRHKESGAWHSMSGEEFLERVRHIALGLYSLGVRKGDRVAMLAESSFYWTLADYAAISTGAINIPIYPTQSLNQVDYILKESQPKIILVSTYRQVKRIDSVLKQMPELRLITFEKRPDEQAMDLETLESKGKQLAVEKPDLFDNLVFDAIQTGLFVKPTPADVALTFLPLSHIFERMVIYLYIHFGVTVCYAESVEAVVNNLTEVKPTIMTSVPRLFEKMYERILKKADKLSPSKKKMFRWAMKVGLQWSRLKDERKPILFTLSIKHALASKLVFS